MIAREGSGFDVVLVSAEPWDDHPFSPVGVIARVLEAEGLSVGIVERPESREDYTRLGAPRLFFGVTSGPVDSMVNNYTPLKKRRRDDPHSHAPPMPDRAVTVSCQRLREHFRPCTLVIGGVEASLRRFAHYDYWDNRVRRSILLDARADLLVYGSGEKQAVEAARRLDRGQSLDGIPGTCVLRREPPAGAVALSSFDEVREDPVAFCRMQAALSNRRDLAQAYIGSSVVQYRAPVYTPADLDRIYDLPFTRTLHPDSRLGMARFSVATHRGCIGACSFCAIALHQGDRVVSRSEESILAEVRRCVAHPEFRGTIEDLSGPSANMYGMDCPAAGRCERPCLRCDRLDRSHARATDLLRRARAVEGVRHVFVRSGIRYDLALESEGYVRELAAHHLSGTLKIAPEHFSPTVLRLMNKGNARFDEFVRRFRSLDRGTGHGLRYYLMLGHPGDDEGKVRDLRERVGRLENIEQFQLFTPTPMTASTCMYWTGRNPATLAPVPVVRDYHTKKRLKRILLGALGTAGVTAPRSAPAARPRRGAAAPRARKATSHGRRPSRRPRR
jgi:uncharacterized radical SAM protein YgiQ